MNCLAKLSQEEFFNRRAADVEWTPISWWNIAEAQVCVSQIDPDILLDRISAFVSNTWVDCEEIEGIRSHIRHFIITCGKHKFNDDLRVVLQNNVVSITSASRVGLYDFGVNRKRVNAIVNFLSQ